VRPLRGLPTNVQSLAFSASRSLLVGAGVRTLAIWNPVTGELLHAHRLPAAATAVAVAPDGSRIAIGLTDGRVLVAGADGATTMTVHAHGAPNVSLAFLADGTLLTGSFDGALERWDVRTGRRLDTAPTAPTGPVASIAVAPGGGFVLTSSLTSGTLHEWSPQLQPLAELPGDPFVLTSVAVTSDGGTALAIENRGQGIAWPLARGSWTAHACRVAGREFTAAEWTQFLPGRPSRPVCP
jgi:WD40 repeat protein